MLNNKRFTIILSLIIAICIWGYVIGETNPTDSRTFRNIPIRLVNEEALQNDGLAILETSDTQMSITITGTRADIQRISAKDIVATVNLGDAAKGVNELRVDIRVPDTVELEDKSLNKITVVVEESRSKKADIEVDYQGTFEEDEEPITVNMSRETVVVSGPASQVEKVAYVRAVVGAGKVTEKETTVKCRLTAVNRSGAEVKNVKLSAGSVNVTSELARKKTVSLEVPILDNSGDLYERHVEVPETISIKGRSSDIEEIDSISTQPVDVSGMTEDAKVELVPILPDGVQISSSSAELTAVVTVAPPQEKEFTFSGGDIEFEGLEDGSSAEVRTETITVTLRGKKDDIDQISEEDIRLVADLHDLQTGTHQVELQVECSGIYAELRTDPKKIRIVIE